MKCYSCSFEHNNLSSVGFRDTCSCLADLHVCKNCNFYDLGSYNECREPVAERVRDKEKFNFCEFFNPQQKDNQKTIDQKNLRDQAEALFSNLKKK